MGAELAWEPMVHVLNSLGQRPWVGNWPHSFSKGCQTIQLIQPTATPTAHRTLLPVVSPGEQKESNTNSFWGLVQIPGWDGDSVQYLNAGRSGDQPLGILSRDPHMVGSQDALRPTISREGPWTMATNTGKYDRYQVGKKKSLPPVPTRPKGLQTSYSCHTDSCAAQGAKVHGFCV